MNDEPTKIEQEEPSSLPVRPRLQLITGGRGGDGNWLAGLPRGTVFLTRPKRKELNQGPYYAVTAFQVVYTTEDLEYFNLVTNVESHPVYIWVNSAEFSLYNDLKKILGDINEPEVSSEQDVKEDDSDPTNVG